MISGYQGRASFAGRAVLAIDRAVTWGMEPSARESMLVEQAADWEAMSRDGRYGGDWRILARQLKGVPVAVWWRLARREVTGIPTAIGMAIVAVATLFEVAIPGYPLDHRLALILLTLALAAGVWCLMSKPRQIIVAEWRPFALLLGASGVGAIVTLPTQSSWSSFDPEQAVLPVLELVSQAGMGIVVAGCVVLLVGSVLENRRAAALVAGTLIIFGAIVVAATEVFWGIWVARVDLYMTFILLGTAFGTVLGAHMMYRLRRLEIV